MSQQFVLPPLILRTELIQPGDVLLTRAVGLESKAIANLSGGKFSHAALCINQAMTFESDGGVIGHKAIRWLGWATVGNGRSRLGHVFDAPLHCELYRHLVIGEISAERLPT